jgi:hypothetical protein
MEQSLRPKGLHFNQERRTISSRIHAIPYGSYSEAMAGQALLLIGLVVVAGAVGWILVASGIL